jgi:hypothetical protein
MLQVIGGLLGVLIAAGIMITAQGITTEATDTTTIGAINQHLEELENQKVEPEWTPDAAATWVQHNIRVSLESCPDPMCFLENPILYEFSWNPEDYSVIPSRFRRGIAELASETQVRDAWFYEDCRCWLVELRFNHEDNHGFLFWAWEDNSWVESDAYYNHFRR